MSNSIKPDKHLITHILLGVLIVVIGIQTYQTLKLRKDESHHHRLLTGDRVTLAMLKDDFAKLEEEVKIIKTTLTDCDLKYAVKRSPFKQLQNQSRDIGEVLGNFYADFGEWKKHPPVQTSNHASDIKRLNDTIVAHNSLFNDHNALVDSYNQLAKSVRDNNTTLRFLFQRLNGDMFEIGCKLNLLLGTYSY